MDILKKLIQIQSSADPTKISASLKGLVGFAVMIASFYGVQGTESLFNELVEKIITLFTAIGSVLTALYAVFGIVRRIINIIKTK